MLRNRTYQKRATRQGLGRLIAEGLYQPCECFGPAAAQSAARKKSAAKGCTKGRRAPQGLQLELNFDPVSVRNSEQQPLFDLFPEAYQ